METDHGSRRAAGPAYPTLHVRPTRGWVNDPNGPFRWRGRYHMFFQHNPHAPLHADVCWGHASSADLASWRMEPVALVPTPDGPDAGGCWSGCVVDDGGTPTAVYTGVTAGVDTATVCLAYAEDDDLIRWRKDAVPVAAPPPGCAFLGYRDPFLFTSAGSRYAIVGAGLVGGGAPTVLLYACDDLRRWTYLGPLLDETDATPAEAAADIWECPQIARIGEHWVLIVSLWRGETPGRVAYLVGDLCDDGGPRFTPSGAGLVDAGHDFYAPAVFTTGGRVLLWGWSWEDRPAREVVGAGWAGALTFPRELSLTTDGLLVSSPAQELEALRSGSTAGSLTAGSSLELPEGPIELQVAVGTPHPATMALDLQLGAGRLRVTLDLLHRRAAVSRAVHDAGRATWATDAPFGGADGTARVRVFVDGSLVEVYVDGGPVFTERVYPGDDASRFLSLQSTTTVRADVTMWRLRRAPAYG